MTTATETPAKGSTDAGATTGKSGETADTKGAAAAAGSVVGDAATGATKAGETAETKAGETKGAAATETGGKAGETKVESKAPEKYELKIPEGGRIDADDVKYLEDIARKAGWSNDDAQAALEEHDAVVKAQSDRWLAATKADKDYGGDKLEESQKLARAVINKIRPEGHARRQSFLNFINRGGAGNHVEVVAFLADLGKLMSEDSAVGGGGRGGGEVDAASKLYGPEPK